MDIEAATGEVGHGGEVDARVAGGRVLRCDGIVEVAARAVLHGKVERVLGLDDRGHVNDVRVLTIRGRGEREMEIDFLTLEEQLGLGKALLGQALNGFVFGEHTRDSRDGFGEVDRAVGTVTKDIENLVGNVVDPVTKKVTDSFPSTGDRINCIQGAHTGTNLCCACVESGRVEGQS